MGKHEAKKNGNKPDIDTILLVTAILELVNSVITLIQLLTD